MKTNQVLIRKMGDYTVKQRTSDSMFNATQLLKQWNDANGMHKEMKNFFTNKQTADFIEVLIKEENLDKENSPYVKSRASRGENSGTWMHPFLFIKFAMWINPKFEYQVIKFVYDELIKYRNDAGDAYREMSKAISKIVDKHFLAVAIPDIAKAMNYVIFNCHEPLLRNSADELKLKELWELERDVAKLIDFGFVCSIEQLKIHLRKQWSVRWQPKCLSA